MADDGPALSTTLQDIDGHYSSKRVAAFIALACMVVGFVAALKGYVIPDWMFNGFLYLAAGGLGLACAERFAPRKPDVQ